MKGILKILLVSTAFFLFHIAIAQDNSNYHKLQNALARGWNTWSYASMTSHVLLPEGFALNINFRQAFIGTPYDPDFFLDQLVPDKAGMVRPVAHSFDGSYTELIIDNWKGNTIRVQSVAKGRDIVILVTPVKKSSTRYFVEIEAGVLWNRDGTVTRKGDSFVAMFGKEEYRAYSTGSLIDVAQPYASPYMVFSGDSAIAFYTGTKITIGEAKTRIESARMEYEAYAQKYGSLAETFKGIQSVLAWNTLYDAGRNRVITPVTRGWNEAWHGYVLFEWDTYFASLLFALDHKELAYANAIAVTKGQKHDGQVGFVQWPHVQPGTQSQPPVGSLVCWMIYEKYQEDWFLKEVYPELLAWNRWWMKNRVNNDYLTWGAGWTGATRENIMLESGLDNSPMYEDAHVQTVGTNTLLNMADVGLNSLYVADCKFLAKIAGTLGRKADEKELVERARTMGSRLSTLWNESDGIFQNKFVDSDRFSQRLSPTLFYPMLAGVPSASQAKRMLSDHYFSKKEFYGQYIIPSCARNDKSYDNDYWRGAIWGPMNFLVYLGLREYDPKAAKELATVSAEMFLQSWHADQRVLENINSEKGPDATHNSGNSDPYYHWGALLGLMKFIDEKKF